MKKYIFNFKSKVSNKINLSKNILGGKGANLSEMGRMGLPVPPGFTISTEVCDLFFKNKNAIVVHRINECDERKNTTGTNQIYLEASNTADHVIFVSSWLRDLYLKIGMPEEKTSVILAGSNVKIFNDENSSIFDRNKKIKGINLRIVEGRNKGKIKTVRIIND